MKKWKKWFGASDASSKVIAACLLGVVVMVGWLVSPAVAAIIEDFRCGTLYVNRTSTLVGDVTITGGLAVTGSTTADMTGDDINANGTEADTLGINFPAAQLTNTLTFVVAPATPIVDGSSQTVDWDVQNDSNETVTAMRDVLTVDDNTTNTEDTAWEKWLEKAGVLTKILDADALGLAVVGNVESTDDMTVGDDFAVGGLMVLTPTTVSISSNAYALTVTDSSLAFYANQVTTVTVANASTAGTYLEMVNMAATNVIFADSANVQSTGAITLGQYDSAVFRAYATNQWVLLSTSNN